MASATAAAATCVVTAAVSLKKTVSSVRRSENFVSCFHGQGGGLGLEMSRKSAKSGGSRGRRRTAITCAAKPPAGVENPREQPKLPVSLWGFTENAEVWNARASMIGLVGIIILEFIAHRGLLEMIGVEVGKGLDIPL